MPYRIFSYISPRALGDVILLCLFTTSVADLFDDADLTVYYRDDRPYKSHVVNCIRNAKRVLRAESESPGLPIETFDGAGWAPKVPAALNTEDIRKVNLVLSQTMFSEGMLNAIPLAVMAPPEDTHETSDNALMELGLDPGKWVATVYWKEPGYTFRPNESGREIADPEPYIAAIRHIVENLGGQVVRMGHASPTKLPKLKGLIDLAHVPNSEWLQLYAVWISRFFLSSNSGPVSYGPAFNVPTVVADQLTPLAVYRSHDYIVTQRIIANGKEYQGLDAFAAELMIYYGTNPHRCIHNTAQELIAAVDEMYGSTANCIGWRAHPEPQVPAKRPNKLCMPLPVLVRPQLFVPPSQRPKA